MKEQFKQETMYTININVEGDFDMLKIVQEESHRNNIKIEFYQDRWRSPKATIKLLEKITKAIKENFINE
jgi:hypothetical protein